MKFSARKAAQLEGRARYSNGKPCKYGHYAMRRVSTGHCTECENASGRKWRAANLERARARDRKYHHKNMPAPLWPKPTICEICAQPPANNALNLDHCHETGRFRGWLCLCCNMALGKLGDNLEGLRKAQAYLERFHAAHSKES